MTTPYLGEIQIFSFNYAPYGWAQCNGALLPISQYSALFQLIGTTYGGNGTTTFGLPNLMGRAPCGVGQAPGLTQRTLGVPFGDPAVTLNSNTMPTHTHAMNVFAQPDATLRVGQPATNYGVLPPDKSGVTPFALNATANAPFASTTVGSTGNNLPHENRQPFVAMNYCIALVGEYPPFS